MKDISILLLQVLVPTVASAISAWISWVISKHVQEVRLTLNGRMDQLLATAAKAAYLEGERTALKP
jgi:hypothetical protein